MPTKPITPIVLSGLGSAGLNTQSQDATLGPEWLTAADNVVFDYQGRISSRKGIKQVSKTIGSSIKSIGCYIKADRTREYYTGAGNAIYKLDTTVTPYSLTSQAFSGTPQTISNGNWQWVNFNDEFWGVQSSHKVVNFDGTNWYDMEDLGTYLAPVGITTFDPSCALGEFGRMWYGGVTEAPGVVFYSDNLILNLSMSHCDCAPYLNGRILVPTPLVTNTVILPSSCRPQCANDGASVGTHKGPINGKLTCPQCV